MLFTHIIGTIFSVLVKIFKLKAYKLKGGNILQEEIMLSDLLDILKKNIKLIAGLVVTAVVLSALITLFLIKPVYSASTQIVLTQDTAEQQTVNYSEIQSNIQLVNTYRVIIKSPRILDEVQKLNPEYSTKQLSGMMEVASESDSQVMTVTVKNNSLKDAVKIANDTADIVARDMSEIMNVKNISILSRASEDLSKSPVSPNLMLNLAIAGVLGFLVSVFIIFLRKALDKTITSEAELKELLDLPVIGVVSHIPSAQKKSFSAEVVAERSDKEAQYV